jgi:hypothetical protein
VRRIALALVANVVLIPVLGIHKRCLPEEPAPYRRLRPRYRGASRMEPDVRRAFGDIYQAKTGASAQQAKDWWSQMEHASRYLADAWAAT